jgi:hypothetical protein
MIQLPCPESCSYLIDARSNASQREMEFRHNEITGDLRSLNDRVIISLEAIERATVNAQRGIGGTAFDDLEDSEILAAVENVIKNLETEETGLIYEHPGATPRIDVLSRRIRETLDETCKDIPSESRPRRSDVLKALTFTREAVKAHIRRGAGDPESSRSYMRFISLFFKWPEEAVRPLIV